MIDRRRVKELIEIVQSTVNTIAVIVAAFWAYMLFIEHREITPKLKIHLNMIHRDFIEGKTWLRGEVLLENVGKTLLRAREMEVRIQLIEPPDDVVLQKIRAGDNIVAPDTNVVMWPEMGRRNINSFLQLEPGERDIIPFEFILPVDWKTIKVYVFTYNEMSSNLGWSATSIYSRESR